MSRDVFMCPTTVQDGNEVFFRIKNTATLKKLMTAYCDRQSQDINAIAFLFDGRRLRPEQTPAEVTMIASRNSAEWLERATGDRRIIESWFAAALTVLVVVVFCSGFHT